MFKTDGSKVGKVQIIETIVPCKVDVYFYLDIDNQDFSKLCVTIYFDHIVKDEIKFMKKIQVEGGPAPAVNTGQDNDDFWLNVYDIIADEIRHRFFNVLQEERDVVIEEIFKTINDAVGTLEIEL